MNLIIVSGAEATCKSAIGKEIAVALGYQYQSKDAIKEDLFDKGGRTTWDYDWYERRAKRQFFKAIQTLIETDTNAVIESNFVGKDKKKLQHQLVNKNVDLAEVYCQAKGLASFKRFVTRNETKQRHPGHHDRRWYIPVLLQCCLRSCGIQGQYRPVGLSDRLLTVDTTDYSKINFQQIVEFVRAK